MLFLQDIWAQKGQQKLLWEAELSDEMSVNLQLNCSTDCTQNRIFSLGISEKDDKSDLGISEKDDKSDFGISSQNA